MAATNTHTHTQKAMQSNKNLFKGDKINLNNTNIMNVTIVRISLVFN